MQRTATDAQRDVGVEFFNQSAEEYSRKYEEDSPAGYALRVRQERVLELFDQAGGKVLDVGCGPGLMMPPILERGCSFWGVDPSPRMIDIARKLCKQNERVQFSSGDAMHLEFPDGLFDAVLCMGVIDALRDRRQAIREMLRVAREVRIFPLLDVNAQESRYLDGILECFQKFKPELHKVNYEFQRGGDKMLRLRNDGEEF